MPRDDRYIDEAIHDLEDVAPVPPKQRQTKIAPLVERVAAFAYQHGLLNRQLSRVISLSIRCNRTIDQASLTRLFKNLYPAEPVSPNIVTRIVGCLGASKAKPPPSVQYLLAHWLVSVYEALEARTHIARFYSVLFDCLDLLSIRRPLCHLLCYLTRRRHVTPVRVRTLLETLRGNPAEEKEVAELLRVFKSYYPDIILGDATIPRRRTVFRPLDAEWFEHMKELTAALSAEDGVIARPSGIATYSVDRGGGKRSRLDIVIPVLKTPHAQATALSSRGLEDLRTVKDFVWGFDKIELPCQVVSILRSPSAMRYLQLVDDSAALRRLETWLEAALQAEIEKVQDTGSPLPASTNGLIDAMLDCARFTKFLPKPAQSFALRLASMSTTNDDRRRLLALMPYVETRDIDGLPALMQVESLTGNDDARSRVQIINHLSTITRHWASLVRAGLHSPQPPLLHLLGEEENAIFAMSESLPTASLEARTILTLSILYFYKTLAEVYAHAPTSPDIRLSIPPAPALYQLAFAPTLTHVSSLASILSKYKVAFEESVAAQNTGSLETRPEAYSTAMVSQFNGYVMDLCNLLWRNRAFNVEDTNAVGCLILNTTVEEYKRYLEALSESSEFRYQLSSVYSLSYSPVTSLVAAACFRNILLDSRANRSNADTSVPGALRQPVTQRSLSALRDVEGVSIGWQEYRLQVLSWMDERGCSGIGDLMRSTMKALRKSL